MNIEKIPITIITGFLGAGKTTLINKIIEKETDKKFAIIENEFSDLPIDGALISGISNNQIFELANGCICCTLDSELQETLLQLVKMDLDFNHLLIETTGIAEPDAIIQNIIVNDELKELFFIDSVCCLIDTINFKANMNEKESIKQLSAADTVIINKTETASDEILKNISNEIKKHNSICEIINTKFCDYNNSNIIDKQVFNESDFNKIFNKLQTGAHKHNHSSEIKNLSFSLKESFDMDKFSLWMDYFLHINQNSIIRVKGVLYFEGISRKIIFQSVKSAYTITEGNFWQANEEKLNKIIFIGRNLDKENIKEGIHSLII